MATKPELNIAEYGKDIRGNMFNDTDFTNMTAEEQAEEHEESETSHD